MLQRSVFSAQQQRRRQTRTYRMLYHGPRMNAINIVNVDENFGRVPFDHLSLRALISVGWSWDRLNLFLVH